jgi:hypothetical protein
MRASAKISVLFTALALNSACAGPQPAVPAANASPTPLAESKKRTFNEDMEYIKISDFDLVYVLRRKDGQAIDGADGSFIRANSPLEVNRRVMADEGRALIIGSNFRFSERQLAELKKRFDFEDLSPVRPVDANANSNANSSANAGNLKRPKM